VKKLNNITKKIRHHLNKRKKRLFLEQLFKEVAYDLSYNNHEVKVYINKLDLPNNSSSWKTIHISINIKGKVSSTKISLLTFLKKHGTYLLKRKVLFEKVKDEQITIPLEVSKLIKSIDTYMDLEKIAEEKNFESKSALIKHIAQSFEINERKRNN
jgi:hypothetical protein